MSIKGFVMLGVWWNDPGAISSGNSRWLMFFVGLVAVSMLIQAIIVAVFAVGAMKTRKRLLEIAEEVRGKALPVIDSAQALLSDTAPKLKIIADNMVETSHVVRSKAIEFDATLSDANVRTRAQVARMDGMVSTALSSTAALAQTVHDGIRVPIVQIAGLVNGFKAGLEVLMSKAKGFGGRHDSF